MKINSSLDLGFDKDKNTLNSVLLEYEPMQRFRHIFKLNGETPCEWYVSCSGAPELHVDFNQISDGHLNYYTPATHNWVDMDIKFINPIGPTSSDVLMEWVRLHTESVTNRMGYSVINKRDVEISKLDPTGVIVEKWLLNGAHFSTINFGNYDFSSNDIEIDCTFRMDNARLEY